MKNSILNVPNLAFIVLEFPTYVTTNYSVSVYNLTIQNVTGYSKDIIIFIWANFFIEAGVIYIYAIFEIKFEKINLKDMEIYCIQTFYVLENIIIFL